MAGRSGSGGTGRFRHGSKRLAFPDFVRADGVTNLTETIESQSDEVPITFEESEVTVLLSEDLVSDEFSKALESSVVTSSRFIPSISDEFSLANEESVVQFVDSFPSQSDEFPETIEESQTTAILTFEDVPTLTLSIDALTQQIETVESQSDEESLAIEESITQFIDAIVSQSFEEYLVALGGTVSAGDDLIEGAEVKVIRENDNEVVRSPFTNSNGNWRVTVEGGPVYHVVTQHSTDDKFFNALSQPFIDTSEPGGQIRPEDVGSGEGN